MERAWNVALLVLLVCLSALACLAVICIAAAFDTHKDRWDIASAIGTLAATAVALWLGLRQAREKQGIDLQKAQVTASLIAPRLAIVANEAYALIAYLEWYEEFGKHDADYLFKLLELVNAADPGLTLDELTSVASLPNRCAFHAARATGICRVLREAMRTRINRMQGISSPDQEISHWLHLSIDASESIHVARDECIKASAPLTYISDGERYAPVADGEYPW